jgi:hypothetical protein
VIKTQAEIMKSTKVPIPVAIVEEEGIDESEDDDLVIDTKEEEEQPSEEEKIEIPKRTYTVYAIN